ncbi:hypothetical protein BDC45DRAFT_577083 [Circinella umbellata]|nr:hypothetical protein BDC45DRAFT_577083 [Circinella umbellata]
MSFNKNNSQQHTIENDGMTLHTLLGQLYGRETMFIKALFDVLSDVQQHELSPYCVGVLEYLKKEHQEGKFCAELSTFIDERLNTKSYNGGKKKGVFGREGGTEEQLQDWYTTANEAMMDACAQEYSIEHQTIIKLLEEKLHNCKCELDMCNAKDLYRHLSQEL